jgi:hypothetical protein
MFDDLVDGKAARLQGLHKNEVLMQIWDFRPREMSFLVMTLYFLIGANIINSWIHSTISFIIVIIVQIILVPSGN